MVKVSFFKYVAAWLLLISCSGLVAGDWPMWRGDAQRSGSVSDSLSNFKPQLLWKHSFGKRQQVWDSPLNNYLMQYDKSFEPIVVGSTVILGFNDADKVIGIDTQSGKIKWTFFCGGPVRLAPAASNGKIYFGSDDGVFYCLNAASGKEVWSYNAAPSTKKLIGNRRVISMWPVRGGAVIADNTVYFSAGIWPFMGVFIYALDAETGELKWLNDHDSIKYRKQPHKPSMAFAGVAPQGSFAVNGDKLIVAAGRSLPAILDRTTGKLLRYDFDKHSKYVGGDFVASTGDVYYMRARGKGGRGTTQFSVSSGKPAVKGLIEGVPVFSGNIAYFSGSSVRAYVTDGKGKVKNSGKPEWSVAADATGDLIKAGSQLIAGGKDRITAIDCNSKKVVWEMHVDNPVARLVAADNKIFAVTASGDVLALGQGKKSDVKIAKKRISLSKAAQKEADQVLRNSSSCTGWALAVGLDQLDLVTALSEKTDHKFVVLDKSVEKVAQARIVLDQAGLYGKRITVHVGTPLTFDLAPYSVELALTQGELPSKELQQVLKNLRPYGGSLMMANVRTPLTIEGGSQAAESFKVLQKNGMTIVERSGALKGSAEWTHNYGSIAQTAKSNDTRVKLPLGLLWWGGSSNMDVLPRHAHGPGEQVVGGRLFIQGIDCMAARDVYTGRILWKRNIPGLNKTGVYFDKTYNPDPLVIGYNQIHIPGANLRGANYVVAEDKLYLLFEKKCMVLDTATGKDLATFTLGDDADWGYIGTTGDLLIAGAGFADFIDPNNLHFGPDKLAKKLRRFDFSIFNKSASQKLVVLNRHTGQILWEQKAKYGFLHNGIVVGGGKIFALDRVPKAVEGQMTRRGKSVPKPEIVTFDLKTGRSLWNMTEGVFGSYMSYSEKHNILLHSTRPSRDMAPGESGEGMVALNGDSGKIIWKRDIKYRTFPILHTDEIISESGKWSLLTGEPVPRVNPITGGKENWSWERTYGCNYPVASEHLLTFRSGAASFYDLEGDGGTGSFGGFKSGCSINLIAADGVLSAPDYTRTCNCSYQNQTSLAMVHMPDLEFWTTSTLSKPKKDTVKRIGVNFGAPGDRKADKTFWVDYPSVGGKSPDPDLDVTGNVDWMLNNAARFGNDTFNWVYASCAQGVEQISLRVGADAGGVGNAAHTLIPKGDTWKYVTAKAADGWNTVAFDDSQWKRGKAGFGYGDGDDATVLKDMRKKYNAVFLRKKFTVQDRSDVTALKLMIGFDDSFVASINGKTVAQTKGRHERKPGKWSEFDIDDLSMLVDGENVLAIAGYNDNLNSSDFSLDPYLVVEKGGIIPLSDKVKPETGVPYTVKLYFAEPDDLKKGDRVFDVSLQGKKVISGLDIVAEASRTHRGIVKTFENVEIDESLVVEFNARTTSKALISGIEIIAQ